MLQAESILYSDQSSDGQDCTDKEHGDVAYIGGVVAPFAMRLEGLLGDCPQQAAEVTELHDYHHHSVLPLHTCPHQACITLA